MTNAKKGIQHEIDKKINVLILSSQLNTREKTLKNFRAKNKSNLYSDIDKSLIS